MTPVPSFDVEVFADENLTTRPVKGQSYDVIWVKLNKTVQWPMSKGFVQFGSKDVDGGRLAGPDTENPTDPYLIFVCIDWISLEFDSNPFTKGFITDCTAGGGEPLEWPTDNYQWNFQES